MVAVPLYPRTDRRIERNKGPERGHQRPKSLGARVTALGVRRDKAQYIA